MSRLRTSPLGQGLKFIGTFECSSENQGNYSLRINSEFIKTIREKQLYFLYDHIEVQFVAKKGLNEVDGGYLYFAGVNIALVVISALIVGIAIKTERVFSLKNIFKKRENKRDLEQNA